MDSPEADAREDVSGTTDGIYRDKVAAGRAQDPAAKLVAGLQLFERGLELTRLSVSRQLGTTDPAAVDAALQQRFDRVRRAREAGLYRPAPRAHWRQS